MLTDVPKARIQFVKFILKDSPKDANLSGKAIEESPCNYFKAQIGTVYFKSCDDTTSYETKTISNNAFKDSGDVAYYKSKDKYSVVYKADTGTIDNSLQGSDKVCYALAVKATNSDKSGQVGYGATKSEFDNRWTVSDAACVNLGKRPTVQVWGGSTFTSGGIRTSITKTNGKTFGSWDDYLIIANSGIKNMSSGAYLISGATDASYCSRSPLTIANSNCGSKKLGNARINTTYSLIEGIYSYYIRSTNKEFADIKDEPLDNGSHYIDSGVLNKAVTKYPILIYNSDPDHKDIYIKNNIDLGLADRRYTDTNVPQVIIYSKGDIYIEPAIKRIDAWILAEGDIYTCATGKDNKRVRINTGASACDIQLTISGPIVANTIYFDRTANGEVGANTITQPAEIVDLNPGLYLFGYNETSSQTQPITTYIQKLAPRY